MNLTTQQLEDSIFLRETMRWPSWPLCPVIKNKDGERQHAVVYDGPDGFYLIDHNIFDTEKDITKSPRRKCESPVSIVLDGWTVD